MAIIRVNPGRVLASVDRRILSGFAEHAGRCIYGGVFDEGSPLADSEGFRTDVLEAVRALKPPVLRWPGGNFVSGYHWTDGIGPRESRPRRMSLAWRGEESNRFGTDEFMRFCSLVGAEPYLCVNMGTGTIDEAQAWLEYCNGTGDTHWANLRRSNGHAEPYGVRYWGLGNEVYGAWQIGALSAEDYVKQAREYAKVMRWTDPSIELVSCGETGWSEWDHIVLEGLAEYIRWHSLHLYTGSYDYWRNVLAPHQSERAVRITSQFIEKVRYEKAIPHEIHIAYDEWNVWFKELEAPEGLEERYNLADALAVATYLHGFVRNAATVKMANLAQLVNVIAPILTNEEGLFLQSIYHPLRMFADHLGATSVDVEVECERHEHTDEPALEHWPYRVADLGPFPVLDAVATRSEDGRSFMLSVINRSPDGDVTADIEIADLPTGSVVVEELNGPEWSTINSFEEPNAVSVTTGTIEKFESTTSHRFPAHSLTVIVGTCR